MAAGFVLLLIVAIAFLAGTRSPQLGFADEYRPTTRPSDGTGLHTGGSGFLAAISPAGVAAPIASPAAPSQQAKAPITGAAAKSATPVAPTNTSPGKAARQVGMHYVIAQSYPDINIAKKACDVLAQAGIPCTVEAGPTGWALRSWYSVVSVKAFDHVRRNPELEAFKDAIETAGAKFATSRSFDRFEPKVYRVAGDATPASR